MVILGCSRVDCHICIILIIVFINNNDMTIAVLVCGMDFEKNVKLDCNLLLQIIIPIQETFVNISWWHALVQLCAVYVV